VLAGNLIWEYGSYNEQEQSFTPGIKPGQTYEVVAQFEAMKYKVAFAGLDVRDYTVGDTTTPWPDGTWLYDGSEVKQADLDKLVKEDGEVFSLVQKQEADKAALKDAVADAEKVDPAAYTDETAKAFKDALAAAQDVLKNEDATQSQVDKAAADLAAAKAALVAKPADGWHQAGTDSWQYAKDGEYVKGAWVSDGGEWYYMDANGFMLDGWMQDSDGNWYFLSQNHDGTFGAMVTGWVLSDGLWYYMNPNAGGPKGAMMTGWQWVNGKCYYLYEQTGGPKGACAISTTINGWQVGPDGAWIQ
jgi:glucan-binding YG repeat protein